MTTCNKLVLLLLACMLLLMKDSIAKKYPNQNWAPLISKIHKYNRIKINQYKDLYEIYYNESIRNQDKIDTHVLRFTGWIKGNSEGFSKVISIEGVEHQIWNRSIVCTKKLKADNEILKHIMKGIKEGEDVIDVTIAPRYAGCVDMKFFMLFLWLNQFNKNSTLEKAYQYFMLLHGGQSIQDPERYVRNVFGNLYFNLILNNYCIQNKIEQSIQLAEFFSNPDFKNYEYRDLALEIHQQLLAESLQNEQLILPDSSEWRLMKSKLTRMNQAKYLINRISLIHCIQTSQPGEINFTDDQYRNSKGEIAYPSMYNLSDFKR